MIDEAGMVGTRQMHQILDHAREAGAKVILVGDNEQLQSIEAGGSFRGIIQRTGYVELAEVRRQQVVAEASHHGILRQQQTGEGPRILPRSRTNNELQTKEEAKDKLLKEWAENQARDKTIPEPIS